MQLLGIEPLELVVVERRVRHRHVLEVVLVIRPCARCVDHPAVVVVIERTVGDRDVVRRTRRGRPQTDLIGGRGDIRHRQAADHGTVVNRDTVAMVGDDEVAQREVRDHAVAVDADVARGRIAGTRNPQVVDRHVAGRDRQRRAGRWGEDRVRRGVTAAADADQRQRLVDGDIFGIGTRRHQDRVTTVGGIDRRLDRGKTATPH